MIRRKQRRTYNESVPSAACDPDGGPSRDQLRAWADERHARLKRLGAKPDRISTEHRSIAQTPFGKAWCQHIDAYPEKGDRLLRARNYVRDGLVIDLKLTPCHIRAQVSGSALYEVNIAIRPLTDHWETLRSRVGLTLDATLELIEGESWKDSQLPESMEVIIQLFPQYTELAMTCTCKDDEEMCKHKAAALYATSLPIDNDLQELFRLRGTDLLEGLAIAAQPAAYDHADPKFPRLNPSRIEAIFGIHGTWE